MKILIIIDESGAKGYSNKNEQYEGEFGIIAGFALPETKLVKMSQELKEVKNSYLTSVKTHITDLDNRDQHELRNQIYSFFTTSNINWFYEAIYVRGFYESSKFNDESLKKFTIKKDQTKENLLEVLFESFFSKGLAYVQDNYGENFDLSIITDRQDQKTLKLFQKRADEYINVDSPKVINITGFDKKVNTILRGKIAFGPIQKTSLLDDISNIKYEISEEDSGLTLAADVLVNSAHHFIKKKVEQKLGIELNSSEAICDHPLFDLCYGHWLSNSRDYSDIEYPYPNS